MEYQNLTTLKAENLAVAKYIPLPAQNPVHRATERTLLISGGEGSGKSLVTAAEIVARHGSWHLVYLVGPTYDAAHKEMDYCYQLLSRIGACNPSNYSRPTIGKAVLTTLGGARIETLSSDDGAKAITGTGESPDVLAMVEAGKQSYGIYLACRARVARSRGTLILSGTIEESERWYPELVNAWQADNLDDARSFIIPTWANTILYPGGRHDPEILALERTFSPDKFMERFGAVPCPPSNLVYREFSFEKHVKPAPYWDGAKMWKNAPVEIAVDPGYAGAYAVLAIQWIGDTVYVIDEVYERGVKEQEIIAMAKSRPWWQQVNGGVGDFAIRQHHASDSSQEVWGASGVYLRSNQVRIPSGIERLRTFLFKPVTGEERLLMDPRCKKLAWELSAGYRYRDVVAGRPVSEEPIDADNHAAKALCYWLYDKFGAVDRPRLESPQAMVESGNPFAMRLGG